MAQKWLSLNACSRCNFTHGWLLWLFFARSLCENSSVSRKQASEEKENHYKETHSQPLLQWVIHFWGSLWADPGINSLTSCSKLPSALCCLLSFLSLVWSCPLYMWLFCDLLYFCLFNLLLWMLWVFSTFVFFPAWLWISSVSPLLKSISWMVFYTNLPLFPATLGWWTSDFFMLALF